MEHNTVAGHLGKRTNRIDQIRLGAAIAVVFGHSWHLTLGPDAVAPLESWLGLGLHELAVHVFFFLSGLLITQSAHRHAGSPMRFAFARFKRIFPGLWAHALVLPLLLILCGAAEPDQLEALMAYSGRLMTIFFVEFTLPGAFSANPFPEALNGSVWSLRHELVAYMLVGGAAALGALNTGLRTADYVAAMLAWVMIGHVIAGEAQSGGAFIFAEGRWVMASFAFGVIVHRLARWVALRLDVLALGWAVAIGAHVFAPAIVSNHLVLMAVCYTTLIVAFWGRPGRGLTWDVSYGVYIYGWPIQQLVVMICISVFGVAPAPLILFVLAMGPIGVIAMASWVFIERPALSWSWPTKRLQRSLG